MKFRKLGIVWSATCGVLCVLVVALWVRSYSWRDNLYVQCCTDRFGHFASEEGKCAFLFRAGDADHSFIGRESWPLEGRVLRFFPFNSESPTWLGFDAYWFARTDFGLFTPHWFLILTLAIAAGAPAVKWTRRFSVRTLLIATTLVAVVLGLISWLQ